MLLLIFFLIWSLLLIIWKCMGFRKLGRQRMGYLTGAGFIKPGYGEFNRKVGCSRCCFLLFGIIFIVFAALFVTQGLTELFDSAEIVLEGANQVKEQSIQIQDAIEGFMIEQNTSVYIANQMTKQLENTNDDLCSSSTTTETTTNTTTTTDDDNNNTITNDNGNITVTEINTTTTTTTSTVDTDDTNTTSTNTTNTTITTNEDSKNNTTTIGNEESRRFRGRRLDDTTNNLTQLVLDLEMTLESFIVDNNNLQPHTKNLYNLTNFTSSNAQIFENDFDEAVVVVDERENFGLNDWQSLSEFVLDVVNVTHSWVDKLNGSAQILSLTPFFRFAPYFWFARTPLFHFFLSCTTQFHIFKSLLFRTPSFRFVS